MSTGSPFERDKDRPERWTRGSYSRDVEAQGKKYRLVSARSPSASPWEGSQSKRIKTLESGGMPEAHVDAGKL